MNPALWLIPVVMLGLVGIIVFAVYKDIKTPKRNRPGYRVIEDAEAAPLEAPSILSDLAALRLPSESVILLKQESEHEVYCGQESAWCVCVRTDVAQQTPMDDLRARVLLHVQKCSRYPVFLGSRLNPFHPLIVFFGIATSLLTSILKHDVFWAELLIVVGSSLLLSLILIPIGNRLDRIKISEILDRVPAPAAVFRAIAAEHGKSPQSWKPIREGLYSGQTAYTLTDDLVKACQEQGLPVPWEAIERALPSDSLRTLQKAKSL